MHVQCSVQRVVTPNYTMIRYLLRSSLGRGPPLLPGGEFTAVIRLEARHRRRRLRTTTGTLGIFPLDARVLAFDGARACARGLTTRRGTYLGPRSSNPPESGSGTGSGRSGSSGTGGGCGRSAAAFGVLGVGLAGGVGAGVSADEEVVPIAAMALRVDGRPGEKRRRRRAEETY